MESHYRHSSFREKMVEHLFIGECLKRSWASGDYALEISRPEVDASGYDLIMELSSVVRHVQLKASTIDATTTTQKIHIALARKPSGCVVWVCFDETNLDLGPFLFFGGQPGAPLPDINRFKIAKHTKANAKGIKSERLNIRTINKGCFVQHDSIDDLWISLFGAA